MMPGIWTCFFCVPCGATVARGGISAEMRCACCQRPMERTEYRPTGGV